MTDFLDKVTKAASSGKSVIVIFSDVINAFDCLSHRKLPINVKIRGMATTLLHWFSAHETSGIQVVNVNETLCESRRIAGRVT